MGGFSFKKPERLLLKEKSIQEKLPVLARTPYRSLQLFQNERMLGHRGEDSWERQGLRPGHAESRMKLHPEDLENREGREDRTAKQ